MGLPLQGFDDFGDGNSFGPLLPTDETRTLVESLSGFGIPQTAIARLIDPALGIASPY